MVEENESVLIAFKFPAQSLPSFFDGRRLDVRVTTSLRDWLGSKGLLPPAWCASDFFKAHPSKIIHLKKKKTLIDYLFKSNIRFTEKNEQNVQNSPTLPPYLAHSFPYFKHICYN